MKKPIIYLSAGGFLFIVSMVRNRNLPIVKRIKIESLIVRGLGATGVALALRFGNFNGKNVVDDVFRGIKWIKMD